MSHPSIAVQPFPSVVGLARPGMKNRAPAGGRRTAVPVQRESEPMLDVIPRAARERLGVRARRLLRADY